VISALDKKFAKMVFMQKSNSNNNFVYIYDNKIYVNLTNRCNNNCVFCIRNRANGIDKDNLWLDTEPTAEDVIRDLETFFAKNILGNNVYGNQVTFCGYGESTFALDTALQIAEYCHTKGYSTRLNTNGLGAVINCTTNVALVSKLKTKIDSVSISLLAANCEDYNRLARPCIDDAFDIVLDFGQECKKNGINTTFSIVDILDSDKKQQVIDLCKSLDISLKIRPFIT